jgi:hypothetical protein
VRPWFFRTSMWWRSRSAPHTSAELTAHGRPSRRTSWPRLRSSSRLRGR